MKAIKKVAFMLVFFTCIVATKVFSATKTPIVSGNWSSIATWGGTLPAPGDDIIINDGTTLTVDGNYTCKSVGFSGTAGGGTLNVNAGFQLTVTTDISCPISTADVKINANYFIGGLGSISCVNFNVNNQVVPSASNTTTITAISTISNMLISGDLVINSTVNQVNKTNNGTFNLQKGTVTVAGAITTVNVANSNSSIIDMVTGSNSPTLILSGPTPFNLTNKGNSLLNANGTNATVNYSYPGAETVLGTTNGSNTLYTNLTLSGSGVKKLSNGITVNGTLSMQGTATTSGNTPTYGASATLEYKGSTAQTTSDVEYPVLGTPAPNLRIDNPLGVTLNDNKKVTGTLSFVNGLLATGTNKISVTTTGSVTGAGPGKYIYGNEEIFYANTLNPSEKFDIGDATTYAPVTVTFSGTTTGSGSLTASTSAGDNPDVDNSGIRSDASVNRDWTITRSGITGFTSYDAVFNYAATDIDAGATPANFMVRKLSGTWGTTNLVAANSLSTEANGMTSFGTFQIGEINVLRIDGQPQSHPGCLGYSTTFSVSSPSLPAPAVKWQRADASGVFTDITSTTDGGIYSNFTSSTLILSNVTSTLNNYSYRAILTNINGTLTTTVATLTITIPPSAAISYAGTPFCATVTTAQPVTQTGTAGGTYGSAVGLSLDGVSGYITPSSSAAGSYTVSYTIDAFGGCPTYTVTAPVTITVAPSAAIYYAGSPFCASVSTAQPVTRTGNTGGTYSSTPGLSINSSSGAITPSLSTPGTYTVTYTVPAANGCAQYSTTTIVNITQAPSATISYAGSPYCVTVSTFKPVTRSGTITGIFSAPAGLSVDPTNGDILPSSSTPGTYTVTYTVGAYAGCATYTTTTSVTIADIPSAAISYAGSPFCTSTATAQSVTRSGTVGGTYSSTPGLSINGSTGAITPSASTPGTYTVTYTVASAACGTYTFTTTVTVTQAPSASIFYAGSPFCKTISSAQPVSQSGNTGGTYSSSAGLTIDPSTGEITPSTSSAGTYTVTYTIPASNGCAAFTTTTTVAITNPPSAAISYAATPFCATVTTAQAVTRTGTAGGTYSSSAGLTINSSTGAITPSTSTPGTYTVTYTIAASGGCSVYTATTTVTITAASASIFYDQSPFCSSDPTAQNVILTGNGGGTFSSTAGLSIDPSTGDIVPATSTPGTYTVTYFVAAGGGCASFSTTTSVTVTPAPYALISYTASGFCTTVTLNQAVKRTGNASGTYSASPAGLTISSATGAIKPSTSTPGTYTVTYTVPPAGGCGAFFATTTVTITASPSGTISYAGTPFCTSVTAAQAVTQTATTGGTFSAPAGLSIDATTGAITPSTSTPGTYTVTYSIAASGGCAAFSTTTSVTISQSPSATISYAGTPFCTSVSGAQQVTRTGANGGSYSSSTGLSLNATSGAINASSSTPGTYTVTYTIAASGGCTAFSTTTTVTITAAPSATISYAANPFCASVAGSMSVTRTGTAGGTFSAATGLSIDATTGAITPSTSTPGTYTVTYSIAAAGGCAVFSTTTSVTITQTPSATISYAGTPFCTSLSGTQPVTRTGTSGGTYSAPTGLSISATTGVITASSSTAGTYTVTYTIAASGGCSAFSTTTSVTITAAPSATISYTGDPFCTSVTGSISVTRTGTIGGTFSSSTGLSIDATTGAITPSTSTAGTYTVTYSIASSGGCAAFSTTTSVTITTAPSATISYAGTPFCTSVTSAQPVTIVGSSGGTFSSTAGLSINATTGAITPSSSSAGTYTVTYKIAASGGCAAFSTTTSVVITIGWSATITYAGTPFCKSVTTAQPVTRSGTAGGTYSSTTGLSIDATTGAITPSASTPGTYTVNYLVPASFGCGTYSTTTSVTITAVPSASISYGGSPYCNSITTAQAVTQNGTSGGTYSSAAGLSINATTGAITPSASTAGTYTVTYTIAASGGCAAYSTTTSVTITTAPSATISYTGNPFCKTVTTAQAVTFTGATGGTYSSTTGLAINATTGAITPSTSTPGTYTVTYTIPASTACAIYTATTTVTITNLPSATISYPGSPYCKSITTAQPVTRTGTTGGTYSSTAGLSISAATGAIAPSASTAGTYTVTYTVAASGGCAAYSTTTSVTITTAPSATISYAGTPFCNTVTTTQAVTQTGTAGGTYSSTTGLTISGTTGAITPSTSTPGTYTVTYTIAASAACATYTATTTVTITSPPSATISYSGTPFCNSITTAQPVTQTGTSAGTYSSTAGLSINTTTGAITPSASTAGTYTVTYTVGATGGCAGYSTTTSVTITAAPSAAISYSPGNYCITATTAQPVTRTGTAGGTYTSTTGLSINASTGAVTPSLSVPGTYTVTYSISSSGGCAAYSTTATLTISTSPSAAISYSGSPFCTTLSGSIPVTQTGAMGGTYSSTAGLSINATTGAITPSASTAGTYTVTYTVPPSGGCAAFSTITTVTIVGSSATISYSAAPFCTAVTTAQAVTRTGTAGGTFSSTTGLSISAAGSITPSTSTPGTYTVSYTLPSSGGCGVYVATTAVTITKAPSATISYPTSPFCTTEGGQFVTLTGTTGGVYSSTAGLSINSSTGTINPSLSTAGTYTVTYSIAASGGCAAFSTTASVTVTQGNTATISYAGNPFCETSTGFATVTLTGTTGGTFSAPSALSMDPAGTIKLNKSIRGDYIVSYTIAATGGCPAFTATTPFNLNQPAVSTIAYPGTTICTNTTTPQPVTLTGDVGGTFTATSGLNVDATSGAVTPYPSPAGTYTVSYKVTNGCGSFTTSATVTIKTAPYATISYAGSPYCGAITTAQAVTRTGTAGGTYSSTPGLTIDANTGAISPFESSAGTYTVTYTVTNGGACPYYATTTVTIFSISSSSISYDATGFCQSDNSVHAVIQDGATNGTFSAPAGLAIDPTTGGITPSSSIPGNYTVTYTVPASGACPSYKAFAAVTITEIPSATIDFTGSPYCSNGGTASVTLVGTAGGVFSSSSGLSIDPATGTITLGTSKAGTYTVNYAIAASGGCGSFSTSGPVEIDIHAIWNGSVSRNWHDANNWSCGGVPTLTSNAVIPSGLVNYPIIYSGIGTTHDITIATGASVIDSGALTIAGTIYNTDIGSINALAGKVELASTSAQLIPSSLFYSKTIQDLVLTNPAGVTLKGPLRVTGSVGFGNVNNCVFTTGDSLTLASVPTSDARVKDITNNGVNYGNVISGSVIVERYMPAKRAYRFLTAPVNSTGSIKANWMENAVNPDRWNRNNPSPGYGTNITGAGDVANGFDPTSTHNPSMFTFNSSGQVWVPIANTSSVMSSGDAYRIIVRGNRDIDMNTNTPAPTPTTLRATGKVVTGNVTFTKSGAGGPAGFANLSSVTDAYNLVANPYASAVNWLTVSKTDIGVTIWIFDPNIPGLNNRGGYVAYNCLMGTSSNPSSDADYYLQSGQAIFVQTAGPNPSVKFKETDKASLHRSVFRTTNTDPNLAVQLLLPSQDGKASSTDGLKVYFSDQYSNSVGFEDSRKLSNQDENIAIARDKSYLSIEGRKPVVESDTIPISMWQLSQRNYLLKVNFTNFSDNVEAYLQDKYLHLTSPLSTHGETTIPVNITSDPASFAADRYKIVFEAYATLPLHLLGVKAAEKNNGVDVGWIAESESNIERYEVEKSADGQQFLTAGTVKAKTNPGPSSNYSWFDLVPFDGDNYYRIKSIDKSGAIKYSSVVKVRITKGISGITVFPNPVHGKVITMRFSNIKQGTYSLRLSNSTGEKVYDGVLFHDRGSSNHSIELKQVLPSGVYQMTISNNEDIENIRLVIQ